MSWKNDNTFIRIREAYKEERESNNYIDDLKKLINGEATAAIQYKFASDSMVGSNQSYLRSHFEEHFNEEWGHYTQLVEALMERGGEADSTLQSLISSALPETVEIDSYDSEYLREFFIDAERNAIKAYQKFYNSIEDEDPDLADIISGIISDERAHKLDFERMTQESNSDKEDKDTSEETESDVSEDSEEEKEEPEEESEEEEEEKEEEEDFEDLGKVTYKGFGNKFE